MKRFIFLAILSTLTISSVFGQLDPKIETIFKNADGLFDQINSMHYFYRSTHGIGSESKITHKFGNGYIEKINNNKLGYKYNLTDQYNEITTIYDGKKVAQVYHKSKASRITDPYKNRKGGWFPFSEFVPTIFTENYFNNLKTDSTVVAIKLMSDTIIEASPCYQVRIEYKPHNIYSTRVYHYLFQKDNYFCRGKKGFGTFIGEPSHYSFIIESADVNIQLDQDLFKHYKNIPSKYRKLKGFNNQKRQKPLKDNKKIPKFKGYTLDSVKVTKDNILNQITVLDFWYIQCSPCLAMTPVLDSIAKSFSDRGVVVYGMNPFDDIKDVRKFKKFSQLSYESLIIEKKTAEKFNVRSYPTIYIVDKEGRVAFSHNGFAEGIYDVLAAEIESLLSP